MDEGKTRKISSYYGNDKSSATSAFSDLPKQNRSSFFGEKEAEKQICYVDEPSKNKSTHKINTTISRPEKKHPKSMEEKTPASANRFMSEEKSDLKQPEKAEAPLSSKSFKHEGIPLVPKESDKFSDTENKWSFSFTPKMGEFDANSYASSALHKEGKKKLNMGFNAKGSLLDLEMQVNSPLGDVAHGITIGSVDASANLRYNLDLADSLGGVGAQANAQVDLFQTYYDYKSPVFCVENTGIEIKMGANLELGWKKEIGTDLSLTEFNVPLGEINLPVSWGATLSAGGYGSVTRTPNHPDCDSTEKTEKDEQHVEITADNNNFFDTDKTYLSQPVSASRDAFFHQPSQSNISILLESTDEKQQRCLLDENYQSPDRQKAEEALSHDTKTSFLQENYVAPEAEMAALKLSTPGNNPQSFFNTYPQAENNVNLTHYVKTVIRHYEQSGKLPRIDVYNDGKGIPTTATGLALHESNKDFACRIIAEALVDKNLDKEKQLAIANEIRLKWKSQMGKNVSVMTQAQANQLEEVILQHKIKALSESDPKIDSAVMQNNLKPPQIAVLVSLKANGVMGKKLATYVNTGNFEAAYTEIREHSCGERNKLQEEKSRNTVIGLQLRREKEAHLFKTGKMINDKQAIALLLVNPSNQEFLCTLGVVEILKQKTTFELRQWAKEFTGLDKHPEFSSNIFDL